MEQGKKAGKAEEERWDEGGELICLERNILSTLHVQMDHMMENLKIQMSLLGSNRYTV